MGMVTDIQRFSLNDGPGIRTTVFFKGCNARCAWCHNPETLSFEPELLVAPELCIGCAACVGFDADRAKEGLPPARQQLTPASADVCFSGALTVAGREMTVEQVMLDVRQDVTYYRTSGGGVTLSGGEAMMQPAFAAEILAACRREGIATAIETNLLYDFSVLEPLLPLIDLVMADVKLMDDEKHVQYVGLSNRQVLDNVPRLAAAGVKLVLRTPVIPGVNDDEAEIAAIAGFIGREAAGLAYYELLNFNPLGASKYERLGADDRFAGALPLPAERIEALADAARTAGIPVRIG
ncbi:MAG: glycyl-radical enzyme activating protein [Clostridiales bacterium]|nr:glycyl-radical enzyme activating protein [Clostridiales bacterium]